MSVTFHLYRVLDDVSIISSKKEEPWHFNFSDGKEHAVIELDYLKSMCKFSDKRKSPYKFIQNIIKSHEPQICKVSWELIDCEDKLHSGTYNFRYLCVDQIEYNQGWCLKNKFFKKKFPTVFCSTKKTNGKFF